MCHTIIFITLMLVIQALIKTIQSEHTNSRPVNTFTHKAGLITGNGYEHISKTNDFRLVSKVEKFPNEAHVQDNRILLHEKPEPYKFILVRTNSSFHSPFKNLDYNISTKNLKVKKRPKFIGPEPIVQEDGTLTDEITMLKDDLRAKSGLTLKVTKAEDKPYSVMILFKASQGEGVCTGSLITLEWVLSAAICFMDTPVYNIQIYAGGNSLTELINDKFARGSQVLKGIETFSHPWFTLDGFKSYYNVALVKAEEKFQSSKTVSTIGLSLKPWTYNVYEQCEINSFGRIKLLGNRTLDYLRKTYVWRVNSPCACLERDREPSMWLCSEPLEELGVCHGDIGAGLVCDGTVRGVATLILPVRHFSSCNLNTKSYDCGWKNTQNVFQNICHSLKWINSYVNLFKGEIPEVCSISEKVDSPSKQFRLNVFHPLAFIFLQTLIL